ncbi:MAG: hypothetical protein O7D86_04910 [Proteobacteria bacterium]|nr:hypothetical protein [Pseudomonadota bacterium]
MTTEQTTDSLLNNVAAGLDHFYPFLGFVNDDQQINLRYGFRLGELNHYALKVHRLRLD